MAQSNSPSNAGGGGGRSEASLSNLSQNKPWEPRRSECVPSTGLVHRVRALADGHCPTPGSMVQVAPWSLHFPAWPVWPSGSRTARRLVAHRLLAVLFSSQEDMLHRRASPGSALASVSGSGGTPTQPSTSRRVCRVRGSWLTVPAPSGAPLVSVVTALGGEGGGKMQDSAPLATRYTTAVQLGFPGCRPRVSSVTSEGEVPAYVATQLTFVK